MFDPRDGMSDEFRRVVDWPFGDGGKRMGSGIGRMAD